EFAAWLLRHLQALGVAGDPTRSSATDLSLDTATAGGAPYTDQAAGVWALSAGSDGIDGSSEAAGAIITPTSATRARALGLTLDALLAANDTDTLFARLGDRLVTGPTGNNLND